jgi:hypothetical protein
VTAAANGDEQIVGSRVLERGDDVGHAGAPSD